MGDGAKEKREDSAEAFSYWRRNTVVLAIGCFMAQVAFTLIEPFLPPYLISLGLRTNQAFWSGVTLSVTSVTYSVMAPVWGALADRHGKRIMMLRAGLGIAVAYVLIGLAQNHWQVLALRSALGLVSGYIPSAIMLTATNTPEANLGYALGIVQTAVSAGAIAGPLVGGAIAEWVGLRGTFFISAFLLFAATVPPLVLVKEQVFRRERPAGVGSGVREAWANPRLRQLFITLFLTQAALQTVQPTLPLWIATLVRERVALLTGTVYSLMGISMALGAVAVGRRVDQWGGERVFRLSFMVAALLFVFQGLAGSVLMLAGTRFLTGFVVAALTVSGNLLVAQAVSPESRGMAFGVLNAVTSIGGVTGPVLGGAMGDRLGLASPFFGSAGLLAVAAVWLWADRAGVAKVRERTAAVG